jgi:N-methylhydantoinase A/oxoprolinase/acetone carboxylase beta subunit
MTFEAGFTPTDALHVLGRIALGDTGVSTEGAQILAKLQGVDLEQFCRQVCLRVERQIENLIIDYIIHRYWGKSLTSFITSREGHPVLGVEFSLKIPLVGVGAAARYFLPGVAERLGTTVSFSENCEVGNAVGAALLGRAASALAVFRPESG